jgi:hypothetical protein
VAFSGASQFLKDFLSGAVSGEIQPPAPGGASFADYMDPAADKSPYSYPAAPSPAAKSPSFSDYMNAPRTGFPTMTPVPPPQPSPFNFQDYMNRGSANPFQSMGMPSNFDGTQIAAQPAFGGGGIPEHVRQWRRQIDNVYTDPSDRAAATAKWLEWQKENNAGPVRGV